ncbi:hypothetical protein BUALT_Bualt06G0031900 [Buddleja alternifolia]|uniref:DEAD/DEAH box helicase domain-containing protein n=1 Tax=Buddleja alternifolia TaxID=168488 RepID=A0AAV6XJ96_9LAMI|nr:hypothetical protein BUALT_Bualt06G0031900 [Buddleja alternifolia]
MGKSDDSIARRRNKRSRKKQENKRDSSSKVSIRVASIIASKKRRQSGKRRMCQGMCFSLPTPENPFNDKQEKIEPSKKKKKNCKVKKNPMDKRVGGRLGKDSQEHKVMVNGKSALVASRISFMGPEIAINVGKPTCQFIEWDISNHSWKEHRSENNTDCPSKFLIMCLNSIQSALQQSGDFSTEVENPLFANAWGLEFWNCYTNGKDVLETNGANSIVEQIAWMASTAADTISMKEKEGISFTGPFLLYLVPSQDKAYQVRQVCKPLKTLGVHTVSLHSGASIDHQIHGRGTGNCSLSLIIVLCTDNCSLSRIVLTHNINPLKSCEPEFLVSTPDRLLELLSIKAIDISQVSLLVIDGLEAPFKGTYFDEVKSIREFISGNPQTVVYCDSINISSSISVVQQLLGESVCK